MAEINGLKIKFSLDNSGLETGLKNAKGGIDSLEKWSKTASESAAAAAKSMSSSAIDAIASIDKKASNSLNDVSFNIDVNASGVNSALEGVSDSVEQVNNEADKIPPKFNSAFADVAAAAGNAVTQINNNAKSILKGVALKLTIDSELLDKGIEKARKGIETLDTWFQRTALAGAAMGAVIVKSNLDSIKELENTARAAGLLTDEFQQGAYAAGQFGIEQDKYGDILKDVNDKVGDFLTTGAGGMVDFFEKIAPKVGITADAFKGLNSQEALGLYVSSLQKANVSQAEMTFYMEAIASDSTRLTPLFKDNAKALNELSKEADDLGIGLDAIDLAKVELANKALSRSAASATSIGQAFTVEVAPILEAVINLFDDMAKQAGGTGNMIASGMSGAIKAVGILANGVQGIMAIFKGLEVAARGSQVVMLGMWATIAEGIDLVIDNAVKKINFLIEAANKLPKVNIPPIEFDGTGLADVLNGSYENALNGMDQAAAELHEQLMTPLYSDTLSNWVAEAKKSGEERAAILAQSNADQLANEKTASEQRERQQIAFNAAQSDLMQQAAADRLQKVADLESKNLSEIKNLYDSGLISDENYQKQKTEIEEFAAANRIEIKRREIAQLNALQASTGKAPTVSAVDTAEGENLAILEAQREQGLVDEQAYQQARIDIMQDASNQRLAIQGNEAAMLAAGGTGEDGTNNELAEIIALNENKLKAQLDFNVAENDIFTQDSEQKLALLAEYEAAKLEQLELSRELGLISEQEYQDQLTAIDDDAAASRQAIAEREQDAKNQLLSAGLKNMATLMTAGSKKLFNIGKAAAISEAVISAYQGISKTLGAYPYPYNIAMAAAHGVAAFNQVRSIASTQFGSSNVGGSPVLGGDGGGTVVAPVTDNANTQSAAPNISISLAGGNGATYTRDQVLGLIEQINSAVGDGATLNVGA